MRFSIIVAALLLTACGGREALKPAAGKTLPVKPYGAKATPLPDALTTPDAQARPARSDELLRESKPREEDPFDLPPPG